MKTLYLTIIALFLFAEVHAQEATKIDSAEVNKLKSFLENWLHPPAVAVENNVQGTVVVSFKVDDNKNITDVQIVKSLSPACDKEALRVFNAYHQLIPLPAAEYTAGVTFVMEHKKRKNELVPFDKSPYTNFLLEVKVVHLSN